MTSPPGDSPGLVSLARAGVVAEVSDPALVSRAKSLANDLSLPLIDSADIARTDVQLLLVVAPRRLELRETGRRRSGSIYVDLLRGATGDRLTMSRSRRVPLARAVGLRHGVRSVVDATAGLGRDALTLAACGFQVTAVERSGVLAALLRDGLARATRDGSQWLRDVVKRLTLVVGDAREALREMSGGDVPDVIYLDPMYPAVGKAALAKKEMRICRRLVGDDTDAAELLDVARGVAARRVVVKRSLRADPLAPSPTAQISSKQIRFDIYRTGRAGA